MPWRVSCLLLAGLLLSCATSPDSPDPGVLKLYVTADLGDFSVAENDTLFLLFWNERAYRDDGLWADVYNALEGELANRNIVTDTVEILSARDVEEEARIGLSHLPPAWYDSLTLSVDHLGYIILDGVRIPVSSALEERRTVVPYRFEIPENDTTEIVLTCHIDSSLERHGDEFKFTPILTVE